MFIYECRITKTIYFANQSHIIDPLCIYPIEKYLGKTYLGERTLAYHSSIGCPFTCSFCAVVPTYEARWKAKSALLVYKEIKNNSVTTGVRVLDKNERIVAIAKMLGGEKPTAAAMENAREMVMN